MIQELSMNLDSKDRTCHRLEKKVRELEGTLSVTNEKRFKLQDTIGTMEKELQNTKAHINQMADMHARYAPGMQNTHDESASRVASFTPFSSPIPPRRSKNITEDLLRASIANMDIIRKRLRNLTRIGCRTNALQNRISEYPSADGVVSTQSSHEQPENPVNTQNSMSETYDDCVSKITDIDDNAVDDDKEREMHTRMESLKEFIDHAYNISQYDELLDEGLSRKQAFASPDFGREVSLYRPTTSIQMNGIVVARDVIAHSLSKIREDIENSILLVSKSRLTTNVNSSG